MTHFGTAVHVDPVWDVAPFSDRAVTVHPAVLVVRDHDKHNDSLESICEFLDIGVEYASSRDDLSQLLPGLRPMAVIADLEGEFQDGFHVMKMVAHCDRSLPVLLLTSNDPALLGAVDAVQEVFGMRRVATVTDASGIGALVDFICHAARDAGMPRLMRV
jgi:ActR/RegA family two-component response regulator